MQRNPIPLFYVARFPKENNKIALLSLNHPKKKETIPQCTKRQLGTHNIVSTCALCNEDIQPRTKAVKLTRTKLKSFRQNKQQRCNVCNRKNNMNSEIVHVRGKQSQFTNPINLSFSDNKKNDIALISETHFSDKN